MLNQSVSLHFNSLVICGLVLLFGLIGGECAQRIRFFPRITGFIVIGFLFGPGGFNLISDSILNQTHLLIDISLSLILFELGRHLDLKWLRRDYGLLLSGVTEVTLTYILVFSLLFFFFQFTAITAALGATIAVSTSPAVVMMIANDISSKGPVTRRTLILTSLNNFFALVLFSLLLPFVQKNSNDFSFILIFSDLCHLFGSILLGLLIFVCAKYIARHIGKHFENQCVLFIGSIILTIGLTHSLQLSSMLSLFTLGAAVRNFDYKQELIEIDFGWLSRLFFIILFVVTGIHLRIQGIWQATVAVSLFILVRFIAKFFGIILFAKTSRITYKQATGISLAMLPMAGLAIGMSNILSEFNSDLTPLILVLTGSVALLNIFTPIITQFVFSKLGEANTTI